MTIRGRQESVSLHIGELSMLARPEILGQRQSEKTKETGGLLKKYFAVSRRAQRAQIRQPRAERSAALGLNGHHIPEAL